MSDTQASSIDQQVSPLVRAAVAVVDANPAAVVPLAFEIAMIHAGITI